MKETDTHIFVRNVVCITSGLCGLNIMQPNYKPYILTYFTISVIVMYYVNTIYSIFVFRNDFILLLQCLCCCSCATQGSIKLYTALVYRKQHVSLLNEIGLLTALNSTQAGSRRKLVEITSRRVRFIVKLLCCIFLFAGIFFLMYPIAMYVMTGQMELLMMVLFPFVDPTNVIGYSITLLSQSAFTFCGLLGNLAADVVFAYDVVSYPLLVDLFEDTMKSINHTIAERQTHSVDNMIRNWIMMHKDIIAYVNSIDKVFRATIFIELTTSAGAILLLTFSIAMTDWLGAYAYCLVCLSQLLSYCFLGTVIEHMNEKVTDVIYSISWYEISMRHKKMVLLALMKSQQAKNLTASFFAPCNVETALSLLKTIYSCLMMLLQFSQ